MNKILSQLDNNISRKRIMVMERELQNMSTEINTMNLRIKSINRTYDKLLFKNEPVGSSSNAIKHLKKHCLS